MQQQLMKIWRCVYPILLYVLIQQITYLVVPVIIIQIQAAPSNGYETNEIWTLSSRLLNEHIVALTTLSALLTIPAALFFYFRDKRRHLVNVLTGKTAWWQYIFIVVMAVSFSISLSFITTMFSFGERVDSYRYVNEILFSEHIVIQLLGIGFIVPVAEEFIFRGLIQNRVRTYLNSSCKAIAVTAVLFGIFHENIVQSIAAMAAGALIGFVYEKYRCFFAPVLFHIFFNLPSVIMQYMELQIHSYKALIFIAAAGMIITAAAVYLVFLTTKKSNVP